MVQPVPAPVSTKAELNSNSSETGKSQKLMLFNRGNREMLVFSYKRGLCLHLKLLIAKLKGFSD
jgi:hypothetical protein